MYIIAYWYKGISDISSLISISTTKCPSVKIDIREHHDKCFFGRTVEECEDFFKKIKKLTRIKLSKLPRHGQGIRLSLKSKDPDECVVVIGHRDMEYLPKNLAVDQTRVILCNALLVPNPNELKVKYFKAYTEGDEEWGVSASFNCPQHYSNKMAVTKGKSAVVKYYFSKQQGFHRQTEGSITAEGCILKNIYMIKMTAHWRSGSMTFFENYVQYCKGSV